MTDDEALEMIKALVERLRAMPTNELLVGLEEASRFCWKLSIRSLRNVCLDRGRDLMRKSERAIIAIAHHEAGHAVAARHLPPCMQFHRLIPPPLLLGLEVTSVSRRCRYVPFARRQWRRADLSTRLLGYEIDVLINLAGPLAECPYTGGPVIAGRDLKNASNSVARLLTLKREFLTPVFPEPKYDEFFDQLCTKTWVMVNERWSAIERVAQGLLECSDLSAADVDDLIACTAEQFEQFIREREADEGVTTYCVEDSDIF